MRYKQSSTGGRRQLENLSSLRFRCCLLWYYMSAPSCCQGRRLCLWQRTLSIKHRCNKQLCLSKKVVAFFSRIYLRDSFSIHTFLLLTSEAHSSYTQERGKVQFQIDRLSVPGPTRRHETIHAHSSFCELRITNHACFWIVRGSWST